MKLVQKFETRNGLPGSPMVCEIILRLSRPASVMAWLMTESGCRFADMQRLRVADYDTVRGTLSVGSESGGIRLEMSEGLREELDRYLVRLRDRFEKKKREALSSRDGMRLARKFVDQLLFPEWFIEQHEAAGWQVGFPARQFVDELNAAARDAGYDGIVHSNTLRLCCAQRWIDEGHDLATLHARLGHRDLLTTMLMVQALRNHGLVFTRDAGHAHEPLAVVA